MKENNTPKTLQQAILYYSDEQVCVDYLSKLRWPSGVVLCPACGSDEVKYLPTRRVWQCKSKHSRKQFSIKIGTIFEDSPIPLTKWLPAIWLIASAKNGISSYELGKALGITQKSAWYMLHRIRLAMQEGSVEKFSGQVEADETFIGGKARFMHKGKRPVKGRGAVGKAIVMGLLERHGENGSKVATKVIPSTKRRHLHDEVRTHVEPGSYVFTDAFPSYYGLEHEFVHQVVDHAEQYVNGHVHTNGMENYWSLLKRTVKGTYVSVEPFHLFRYLDEQAFRFNHRQGVDADCFELAIKATENRRLTYNELTGNITSE